MNDAMAANNQQKKDKLYVWLEPETKAEMQQLVDDNGSKYESLSRLARLWIQEKLEEARRRGELK